MTIRWQLDDGIWISIWCRGEVLKEDKAAKPWKITRSSSSLRKTERPKAVPTFSPFPAATKPWRYRRYARSDQRITNQIPAKAMRHPGIMDVKE